MAYAELVFVPFPAMGHLVSMVEMAKLLVDRDPQLSVTVLIMKLPFDSDVDSYAKLLAASVDTSRIRFVHLPPVNTDTQMSSGNFLTCFAESNKPHVKQAVAELTDSASSNRQLAGFLLDMFCTSMIELANEFRVPSYMFFASNAAFLGLMLHLQSLQDEQHQDITKFKDSAAKLDFPKFQEPVACQGLTPSVVLTKDEVRTFLTSWSTPGG